MTHWQRDVPGSFTHADPPPTLLERACRPMPLAALLSCFGAAIMLMFAAIIYG